MAAPGDEWGLVVSTLIHLYFSSVFTKKHLLWFLAQFQEKLTNLNEIVGKYVWENADFICL